MNKLIGTVSMPLLLSVALLGASEQVNAQTTGDQAVRRAYVQAGYVRFDIDGLNADLVGVGLPALERDFLTLGGAAYTVVGRFLFGAEGHAILGRDETTANAAREVSGNGGYGLLRVGYLAVSTAGIDVFPTVGIGGGGMGLSIVEQGAPTFDDVLTDPETAAHLSTRMFLLDAGLAANYRINSGGERGRGFLVGLQAGYTFAPGRTEWRLDGSNDVAGGPAFQIEGPYLRISLGGWAR